MSDQWEEGYKAGCEMSHSLGCDAVEAQRDYLVEATTRVRALHTEHEGLCTHCAEYCDCLDSVTELGDDYAVAAAARLCTHGNVSWPCATIRALDGEAVVSDDG